MTFFIIASLVISCNEITSVEKHTDLELLLEHDQILVPGNGGAYSFNYKVTDPVEGGRIEVLVPAGYDWIVLGSINEHDESYGLITLEIAENIDKDNIRNAVISVKYTFDGESISKMFNLIQEFVPMEFILNAKYGLSQYWGNRYGYWNHHIYLTDTDISQPVDNICELDLFTKNNSEDMMPLPGVYTVVNTDYAWTTDFAIDNMLSSVRFINENGDGKSKVLSSGQITIEKNGTVYNIYGDLYDVDGRCYRIIFENGEFSVQDRTYDSQINEDIDETYSDMKITAFHVGDMEMPNTNLWFLNMSPSDAQPGDAVIQMTLSYDLDVVDGIEGGVFVADTMFDVEPNTFLPGYFSAGYYGSWYFTYIGQAYDGTKELGSPIAPFKFGQIELVELENGNFDVIIDVEEDNDHTIKIVSRNVSVEYDRAE